MQSKKTGAKAQQHVKPPYDQPKDVARSGEHNEQQVITAIKRHNQNVLPVLNRSERKLVRKHLIDELSQGFDHRRQALGMVLETRLHSIREACNHVLVTGKTHLRQQRIEYFGQVFRQVEQSMSRLSDDFLTEMDARFERLNNYKSETIRQREKQRLEKSVNNFLDTLDQLMDEFRSIISEHINHTDSDSESTSAIESASYSEPYGSEEANEYSVNDVVDQFIEADIREKY